MIFIEYCVTDGSLTPQYLLFPFNMHMWNLMVLIVFNSRLEAAPCHIQENSCGIWL